MCEGWNNMDIKVIYCSPHHDQKITFYLFWQIYSKKKKKKKTTVNKKIQKQKPHSNYHEKLIRKQKCYIDCVAIILWSYILKWLIGYIWQLNTNT